MFSKVRVCSAARVYLCAHMLAVSGPAVRRAVRGERLFPVLTQKSDDFCHSPPVKEEKQSKLTMPISYTHKQTNQLGNCW